MVARMRLPVTAIALALSLGLLAPTGCGRTRARLSAGIEHYERGAYEGALIRLKDVAEEEARLKAKHRVRYFAYRGLAHWHLRQLDDAKRYLAEAQAALAEEDADPKWLPSDVRDELDRAGKELALVTPPKRGRGAASAEPVEDSPAPSAEPPASSAPAPSPPPSASATDAAAPAPSVGGDAGAAPPAIPSSATTPPPEPL
jgi:hypothetical protein